MDSRPILNKSNNITIFIDSESFENELINSKQEAFALLDYYGNKCTTIFRSPFRSKFSELNDIPEYNLVLSKDHETNYMPHSYFEIKNATGSKQYGFIAKTREIENIAKTIFHKKNIDVSDSDAIKSIFIQSMVSQCYQHSILKDSCASIFVTQNNAVISNRLWFENQVFNYFLNIMTVSEAVKFLDLFFKYNRKYHLKSNTTSNKGYLYELALKEKLPHLTHYNPIITALSFRAQYSLMAIDEMGIQPYLGVNNDTNDTSLYHFFYLIMLITGIFDNLALEANDILKINYLEKRKIGLSTKCCNDFLKEIRVKNPDIRNHITNYVDFIKLIYYFREKVIHREGLSVVTFHHNHKTEDWLASFIKVTKDVPDLAKRCGDRDLEYDAVTKWGIYTSYSEYFVMPYFFSISAVETLFEFTDKFLELLGYKSRKSELKKNKDLEDFKKYYLGF